MRENSRKVLTLQGDKPATGRQPDNIKPSFARPLRVGLKEGFFGFGFLR